MQATAPGNEGVWESVAGEVEGEKTRSGQAPAPPPTLLQCGEGGGRRWAAQQRGRPEAGAGSSPATQAARGARAQRHRREAAGRRALPGGRCEPSRRWGGLGRGWRGGAVPCGPSPLSRDAAVPSGGGCRGGALRPARGAPGSRGRASPERSPESRRQGARFFSLKVDKMVTLIHTLADHSDDVNCCAFSPLLLATCSLDKTVRIYSLNDFTELSYSPLKGHTYAVHCCCFSPSGHILASCSTDGTTMVWDTRDGQVLAVLGQPSGSPVRVCRFSPESTYLVSGAADGSVVLWNMQSLKMYRSGSVKDGSLVACAFSPNGNCFVTGSSWGDITIWDDTMRCLYNEKAHDLGVTCCDISSQPISDGEHGSIYFQMASCGQDNKVKVWLILFADSLGVELRYKCTLSGHSAPVLACAFSCDGQMLVSGSVDKCVIIYETNTGNILHTLSQHTRYVTTCVFAPCTALLATGSMDKTVNIWQFDSKQPCAGNTVENESEVAVQNWSEDDVSAWLCAQGLTDLVGLFKRNNIDGKELLHLTKESLTNELKIESLGLRSKILQKTEELRMKMVSVAVAIPDEFLCPITRELMKEPVIAADGYSYEKEAMENWISNKRRSSPMTNLPLHSLMLTPNRTLKMAISRWLETQQKYGETT